MQQFVSNVNTIGTSASEMKVGELAEVISPEEYKGSVIVRTYFGLVSVYSTSSTYPAFDTVWSVVSNAIIVRLLIPGEKVILSND